MSDPAIPVCARDVMTPDPAVCPADATVDQVAKLMAHDDCRAIVVIDLAERPHGIVTDRDIIRRVVAEGRNPLAYPSRRACRGQWSPCRWGRPSTR